MVGLETSVAGITIIALGTSLPDTFASRTAAVQDEHADAAIGNVTGKEILLSSLCVSHLSQMAVSYRSLKVGVPILHTRYMYKH